MKLASLKEGRDGRLLVVDRALKRAVVVPGIAPTLQAALDEWDKAAPRLAQAYAQLNDGRVKESFPLDVRALGAPLPRAYQWCDGSAYLSHMELVRRARGADMPESFLREPLIYQGGSDDLMGATADIVAADEAWGIDFEAEVAAVLDDVPMGVAPGAAGAHIKLLMLVNDVSLRNLIPGELAKGFGFFQSKPATAFSPVAVSPGELAPAWDGGKLNLPIRSFVNGRAVGQPNAGVDMTFEFPALIAHAARTRNLGAGTILGGGTVANRDPAAGASCIAELRARETIQTGEPATPFLKFGDSVRIDMVDGAGATIFGAIDQRVRQHR
jgi:fumarylacetoacetate (FAA) hydrolase